MELEELPKFIDFCGFAKTDFGKTGKSQMSNDKNHLHGLKLPKNP